MHLLFVVFNFNNSLDYSIIVFRLDKLAFTLFFSHSNFKPFGFIRMQEQKSTERQVSDENQSRYRKLEGTRFEVRRAKANMSYAKEV